MDALKKIGSTIKKETTDFAVEHEKGVKLVAKGVDFVNPVTHIPIVGDKFKVGNVVDKTITDAKK